VTELIFYPQTNALKTKSKLALILNRTTIHCWYRQGDKTLTKYETIKFCGQDKTANCYYATRRKSK